MSRRPLLFLDVDGPLNPYGRPALLRHVDPRLGLREGDFAAPAEFAVAVRK